MSAMLTQLCLGVGMFVLARTLYRFISFVITILGRSAPVNLAKYGEWAVVTGASDGIGKAFCAELAKQKLNIVLISRTKSKLDAAAKEIEEKYGVKTKVIAADLGQPDAFAAVAEGLAGMNIGVLINNVGISYNYPDFLMNVSEERVDQMIALNVTAVTKMCRIVLTGMIERKSGAIVNIGSISGSMPMSLLTVYSATKRYVDYFSKGLATEYGRDGIFVQALHPAFVSSAMSKMRSSMMVPKPETFAKSAVSTIGKETETSGFVWHDIQAAGLAMLPAGLASSQLHSFHLGIRKRAIKKAEREAGKTKPE